MRYIVKRYYHAGPVEYQAGQVIEIGDPEYAAWLNRDMRGMLAPVEQAAGARQNAVQPAAPAVPRRKAKR